MDKRFCYIFFAFLVAEGFFAPILSLLNATSILVEWEEPVHPNGVILSYQLTRTSVGAPPLTTSHDLSTMTVLTDLIPFTLYLVSVSVTNTEGTTVSPQANITTGQTGKRFRQRGSDKEVQMLAF